MPRPFTKNRDRLLEGDIAAQFLAAVLAQDNVKALLSSEHFSVDGTLREAWASLKSFRPKDGSGDPPGPGRNGERDFHGEPRRNDTHVSTTDPETRLFRKGLGKEARLCFMGHALMENCNGLIVGAVTTTATGHAERWAAVRLIEPHAATPQPVTLGADKGYDSADFVMALRDKAVTPHVAQHTSGRRSAIDEGTAGHPGYAISQRIRKRVEEAFGWAKTVPACARCGIADCSRSIGNSPSPWPPMTSSACPNCSLRLSNEPTHISNRTQLPARAHSNLPQIAFATATPDHRGSQNAPKSIFFPHPARAGRVDARHPVLWTGGAL